MILIFQMFNFFSCTTEDSNPTQADNQTIVGPDDPSPPSQVNNTANHDNQPVDTTQPNEENEEQEQPAMLQTDILPLLGTGCPTDFSFDVEIENLGSKIIAWDSGGSRTTVDPDCAEALALPTPLSIKLPTHTLLVEEWHAAGQPDGQCDETQKILTLGMAPFAGYSLGVDCVSNSLWVTPSGKESEPTPHPDSLSTSFSSPAELIHNYPIIPCGFSDSEESDYCMVDTGAWVSMVFEHSWPEKEEPARRVPQFSADYAGNPLEGFVERGPEMSLGAFTLASGHPFFVLEEFKVLSIIESLVERPLIANIGVEIMMENFVSFDLDNQRLLFFPHPDTGTRASDNWYLGHGLVFDCTPVDTNLGSGLKVIATAAGSIIEQGGVQIDDLLLSIDGQPWHQSGLSISCRGIFSQAEGNQHSFGFLGQDLTEYFIEATSENLLPRDTGL